MSQAEHGPFMDATHPDAQLVVRGCCIRFDGGAPYVHANSTHISTGVEDVFINADGYLEVKVDNHLPVVTCGIFMDETLAGEGITAGASGGGGTTRFKFYKRESLLNLNYHGHYGHLNKPWANVWLLWVNVVDRGTGGPSVTDRLAAIEQRLAAAGI